MDWYFFSFSYDGKNQGCCIVQEDSKEGALQKTIDLGIHPKHDHIICYLISEPELTPDRLYSPDELDKLDYERKTAIVRRRNNQ